MTGGLPSRKPAWIVHPLSGRARARGRVLLWIPALLLIVITSPIAVPASETA